MRTEYRISFARDELQDIVLILDKCCANINASDPVYQANYLARDIAISRIKHLRSKLRAKLDLGDFNKAELK